MSYVVRFKTIKRESTRICNYGLSATSYVFLQFTVSICLIGKTIQKMTVDLGFVEKCESWQLESRFFPSKVGGKPAWLDLKNIPGEKDLLCKYCREPCIFLCQIYAPYEDNEDAFHRTIFVFICKKVECSKLNENGNLKVFRSQLPRINEFYSSEPPVEQNDWRIDIGMYH